jgi:hypothetical protein
MRGPSSKIDPAADRLVDRQDRRLLVDLDQRGAAALRASRWLSAATRNSGCPA